MLDRSKSSRILISIKSGTYAFNNCHFRKIIYMLKQSQRILLSLFYNFLLHRDAGNLGQAQTFAMNSACELRVSSQNICFDQ